MRRTLPNVLAVCAALALSSCAAPKDVPQTQAPGFRIAVIPQGATHEFWKSIHAGALKACEDLKASGVDVEVIWKAPLREDDREQQVQAVEGFLAQKIDGIVLAPFDKVALVRPVEEAKRAGIPTVVVDSGLESKEVVSFLASDNRRGGALAADHLAKLVDGRGRVLLLRYQEGVASTEAREAGFVERIKTIPGIELVSSDQYAGATRDTAKAAAENLLNRFGDRLQGIFTPNESSTAGTLLALEDLKRAGKIKFVGFDTSDVFISAMRDGKLHGLVVQNPFRMGELGVKTLVDHLRGKPVLNHVDTGVTLVTPETLDSPDAQTLLRPPLAKYLGAGNR
jgi:ribose transport system substrate-binding protein